MRSDSDKGSSAEELDDKYNQDGEGEHPKYTRHTWQTYLSSHPNFVLGYWEWIAYMVRV